MKTYVALFACLASLALSPIALASPVSRLVYPASASAVAPVKQMRVLSDGTLYAVGTSTTQFLRFNAAGDTATAITYGGTVGTGTMLPSHVGADFVTEGSTLYLATTAGSNGRVNRYDLSGATATLVARVDITGSGTIAYGPSGSLYGTRSTAVTVYDSALSVVGSATTVAQAISRTYYESTSGMFYYLSTSGTLRRVSTLPPSSTDDVVLVSSIGTSPNGVYVSPGGGAYVSMTGTTDMGDTLGSIRKYALPFAEGESAVLLWTLSIRNLTAMAVGANGDVYYALSNGTIGAFSPINVPTSAAGEPGLDSITLTWDRGTLSEDTAGVSIRRSTSGYPTTPAEGTEVVARNTGTSFVDTGLAQGTTYYYSVFNETRDGYFGAPKTFAVTTDVDTTAPAAPGMFAVTADGTTATLSWANPSDSDFAAVVIRRSTTSYPTAVDEGVEVPLAMSAESIVDEGLESGNVYYYSIFALDANGNVSEPSSAWAIVCDLTCAACDGPAASECTSCATSMFLDSGTCSACAACGDGEYVASACTETSDTVCAACSACPHGQIVASTCEADHDTVCEDCPVGSIDPACFVEVDAGVEEDAAAMDADVSIDASASFDAGMTHDADVVADAGVVDVDAEVAVDAEIGFDADVGDADTGDADTGDAAAHDGSGSVEADANTPPLTAGGGGCSAASGETASVWTLLGLLGALAIRRRRRGARPAATDM